MFSLFQENQFPVLSWAPVLPSLRVNFFPLFTANFPFPFFFLCSTELMTPGTSAKLVTLLSPVEGQAAFSPFFLFLLPFFFSLARDFFQFFVQVFLF